MTKRLVFFLCIGFAFMFVLKLTRFRSMKPNNQSFNIVEATKAFDEHQKLIRLSEHTGSEEDEAGEGKEKKEVADAGDVSVIPLDTPELKNGMHVFTKKGQCITCHGKSGEGKESQLAPKLAGQHDWYIVKQLHDMKNKVRDNPKMNIYLKKLDDKDMSDVAQYLSKLPRQ